MTDIDYIVNGSIVKTFQDRYELRINSGVVQLTLDTRASRTPAPIAPLTVEPKTTTQPASALEILLDGVEARVRRS